MFGKNYGAISCESCKCLFRRNAHKYETLNCIYDNNCAIDVLSRKYCRKCRLRKCFAVGMRRERIWTEDERALRSSLIHENRVIKQMSSKTQNVVNSNINIANYNMVSIESNDHDNSINMDNQICPTIGRPFNTNNSFFNDMETKRLIKWFKAVHSYSLPTITSDYQLDVINKFSKNTLSQTVGRQLMAIFLERLLMKNVKVAKSIDAFVCLPEHDQILLIKYGSIELCMLLKALYFENNINYHSVHGEYTHSSVSNNTTLYQTLRNIYNGKHSILDGIMDNVWEHDCTVSTLMSAIIIFNPNRPHLIHRDVIEFQQHVYKHLLQKYLHFKYQSKYESSHKFQKLINFCGDKARGKNFNAISCESCKKLFRRNAHKYESLNCIYDNNCTIDVLSRKYCRKCRLRKCFAVGMRRERIWTEDETSLRSSLIQENRLKRKMASDLKNITIKANVNKYIYNMVRIKRNDHDHNIVTGPQRALLWVTGMKSNNLLKANENHTTGAHECHQRSEERWVERRISPLCVVTSLHSHHHIWYGMREYVTTQQHSVAICMLKAGTLSG
ncbi:unnamed protein product [Medioppia subpectinata]|uniref:Nuclear receptor domain-containing protein n=1 Tax=Medioppia subpectinata TaxID=1979941 RepID=A0A7R9KE15_9ACAR|nr:unnamed protein product [Medioppia subpectinata]CAG2100420.1 unnamed protein product [Medioppia subpectinata]